MHVGNDPITVFCDDTGNCQNSVVKKNLGKQIKINEPYTGMTLIGHNLEVNRLDTGTCTTPGCYTRAVTYNVTYRQMEALIEISDTCRQNFQVFENIKSILLYHPIRI